MRRRIQLRPRLVRLAWVAVATITATVALDALSGSSRVMRWLVLASIAAAFRAGQRREGPTEGP